MKYARFRAKFNRVKKLGIDSANVAVFHVFLSSLKRINVLPSDLWSIQQPWFRCPKTVTSRPAGANENGAIVAELQTLHSQLLATNKIGLMIIHQHGQTVLPTISKILNLQMHFDNVCSEAHSKHCHIDKSQLQLKLFRVGSS